MTFFRNILFGFLLINFSCEPSGNKNRSNNSSESDSAILIHNLSDCSKKEKRKLNYPIRKVFYEVEYIQYDFDSEPTSKLITLDSLVTTQYSDTSAVFKCYSDHIIGKDTIKFSSTIKDTITFENLHFPINSRESSCELFMVNDRYYKIYKYSHWMCPDPKCDITHDHLNNNWTKHYSIDYGLLCEFSAKDKSRSSVSILNKINYVPIEKALIELILKRNFFDKNFIEKILENKKTMNSR